MSTVQSNTKEPAAEITTRLLHDLFPADAWQSMGVRLWDGMRWPDEHARPTTLLLNHPGALRSMILPGTEAGLGLIEIRLLPQTTNDFPARTTEPITKFQRSQPPVV